MTPVIELRNVHRSFEVDGQTIPVLQDIDLSVEPNEIICLVGESGCGKTTTGKIVAGLLNASSGEVLVHGRPISSYTGKERAKLRSSLQIVHQDPFASLNPAHTIGQILSYPLKRHKVVNGRNELRRKSGSC